MRREVWRKFRSPTPQGWLRKVSSHGRINICYHSEILTNLFAFEKYWTKPSLRKQLTFGDATTGFPAKWRLRNERRNSIFPYLVSASDWLNEISHAARKHYPDLDSDASLGTCQKLAGGGGRGVETEGGSQRFETQKREGSWKMGHRKGEGHANICPWSYRGSPTEEKGSSLSGKEKKKKKKRTMEHYGIHINCEVLLQEFNKHLLLIYNNAIES